MNRVAILGAAMIYFYSAGAQGASPAATRVPSDQLGRPVRVVTISFQNKSLETIRDLVEAEAAKGTDVIVLPETWRGQKNNTSETLAGPTISVMARIAAKYRTYIVCPIDRKEGVRRYNSAVFLDRNGQVVSVYNKVYPYWSEFDLKQPVTVGDKAPIYQADFGRVGFAICFDVNFPSVWQRLADEGAEIVLWPSAYSAGTSLQAHAINHHYYIATATGARDSIVYDITGEQILYETSPDINVSRITLDLDRGIYHENFNLQKRDKLLKEHAADVEQEKWMRREAWFVLKVKRPGVSARALARQYGLEELRDYLDRSRREIDRMRGWIFPEESRAAAKQRN
jgi:predicted amidohydrolase